MKFFSLKHKLLFVMLLTSMASIICVSFVFVRLNNVNIKNQSVNDLALKTKMISENLEAALAFHDNDRVEVVLASLRSHPDISQACVYDRYRNLIAMYKGNNTEENNACSSAGAQIAAVPSLLSYSNPIFSGDSQVGSIIVFLNLTRLQAFADKQVVYASAAMFLVFMLISYPLASMLQNILYRPIGLLAEKAVFLQENHKILPDTRSQLSRDEISHIQYVFSKMLNAIEVRNTDIAEHQIKRQALENNINLSLKFIENQASLVNSSNTLIEKYLEHKASKEISKITMNSCFEMAKINKTLSNHLKVNIERISDAHSFAARALPKKQTEYIDVSLVLLNCFNTSLFETRKLITLNNKSSGSLQYFNSPEYFHRMLASIFDFVHSFLKDDIQYVLNAEFTSSGERYLLEFECTETGLFGRDKDTSFNWEAEETEIGLFLMKFYVNAISRYQDKHNLNIDIISDRTIKILVVL